MEPSATFGRGHKHSSSLLGPEPRSHPLPELATLAPTSPSFAGRGDVSGLFLYRVGTHLFRYGAVPPTCHPPTMVIEATCCVELLRSSVHLGISLQK